MTASLRSSPTGPTPLDVVFMGTPVFAAESLGVLLDGPHKVVAVVTRPDKPRGRGKKLAASPVKELALENGIRVVQPSRGKDPQLLELLTALRPDVSVVVAYGSLLPVEVIEAPRLGTINAHASILPLLRGAAPIQRAILEGFESTGVTIMQISEEMDAGDIMISESVTIGHTDTTGTLTNKLSTVASQLLGDALDSLARGDALFTPQDAAAATYAPPIKREETAIDWSLASGYIDRQIRAFAPKPGAFTFDGQRRLKIIAARPATDIERREVADTGAVVGLSGEAIVVACGTGQLVVERLQPEGRKPMAAADYLRGYHNDDERIRLT